MKRVPFRIGSPVLPAALALLLATAGATAQQPPAASSSSVYRCPGPPVLYTDTLTPQEAKERGCRSIEGAPVTVIQGARPRLPAPVQASGPRNPEGRSEARVDPGEQRSRDGEARRILETELKREEDKLAELKREFNNGEPERQGGERNYQKYLDRVAAMKENIDRKEADVAALKRELAKLPPQ
jgi:hypothetical protein